MNKSSTHWARIGEDTFVYGIWALYGIYRVLGRLPFRICLYPVVFWYWVTRPIARRASLQYLQRLQVAYGVVCDPSAVPGLRHSLRHFLSFAETILDKMLALSGRYHFDGVRYKGMELMQDLMARGEGALIITAHVGCLELYRKVAEIHHGSKLNILVHTAHAERFNAILKRMDSGSQVKLLQVSDVDVSTAAVLLKKIEAGEFVAMAGDRTPIRQSKVTSVNFLGYKANFPVGPYVLAALLKCPLIMLGGIREGKGYALSFEKLADRIELPRQRRDQEFARHAAIFAVHLESLIKRSPYDWFNFYPFWAQIEDELTHHEPSAH